MNKRERNKKYREEHKEQNTAYHKKYYQDHKEQWKIYIKKWSDSEKGKEYQKKYREDHREQNMEYQRRYRENKNPGIKKNDIKHIHINDNIIKFDPDKDRLTEALKLKLLSIREKANNKE